MGYSVVFAAEAEHDFELIFDFLIDSYCAFGEDPAEAIHLAEQRVISIRADIEGLADAPYRGTLHDDLLSGVRHVTLGRAIVWFDIDETREEIRILAVFFGGQDHQRHMLTRLLSR